MNHRLLVLVVGVLLGMLAPLGWADDVQDTFDRMYKPKIDAARTVAEKVDAAVDLLHAARSAQMRAVPELELLLCRKAMELAGNASGKEAAYEANKGILRAMLDKADGQAKMGEFDAALTAAGEALKFAQGAHLPREAEIQATIDTIKSQKWNSERLKSLKASLDKADTKEVREQIITLLVLEMDDPGEANKLVSPAVNQTLGKNMALAVTKMDDLAEADCLRLAKWYLSLAAKADASSLGKCRARKHAKAYGERFLDLHPGDDPARRDGLALCAEADKKSADSGWIDALYLMDLTCPYEPKIKRAMGRLESDGSVSLDVSYYTASPIRPMGSYVVEVVETSLAPSGGFELYLPVGTDQSFFFMAGGLDNHLQLFALAKKNMKWPVGKRTLTACVSWSGEDAQIIGAVNGEKFVEWSGKTTELYGLSAQYPNIKGIGIKAPARVYSVRVKMITGEAMMLESPWINQPATRPSK